VEQVRRDFEAVASRWDSNPTRLKIAHDVAAAIMRAVQLSPQMDVLDYGCGTGLVAMQLQPHVKSVTGADSSPAMLDVLKDKIATLKPQGQIAFADLDTEDGAFHGDNTGVFHLGFDRAHLRELLLNAGFSEVRDTTATVVHKEIEGQERDFPIFLIAARKM
jgi:SAM-dependent methyltransferase